MIKKLSSAWNKFNNASPVFKASFWFLVCSIIQKCIALFTTPILTRLMTTEEYGQFTVYVSWYSVFLIFISFKLDGGVFNKGMSKFPDEKYRFASTMQGIVTCTCILFIGFIFLFKKFFLDVTELSQNILILMCFHILFTLAINFWTLRERYDFRYKSVVIVTFILAISNSLLGIFFVLFSNNKGIARIISNALVYILIGLVIYIFNIKKGQCFIDKKIAKFSIFFNIPLIPHYLSMYILNSSDRIMIQKMCGTSEVALYGVVYNLALVLLFIVDSINGSLAPWLYNKMENNDTKDVERIVLLIALGLSLVLALFILVAPEIVYIMAGDKYMEAVKVMPCITASILCIFLYQLIGNIEFYYDANKFTMYVSMIGAALNIVLNYIAIPQFGYAAAGYTTLICYLIFVIAHSLYSYKLSIKKEKKVILSPLKISGVCFLLSIYSIVMSMFYDTFVIRYSFVLLILIIAFIFRRKILCFIGKMQRCSKC